MSSTNEAPYEVWSDNQLRLVELSMDTTDLYVAVYETDPADPERKELLRTTMFTQAELVLHGSINLHDWVLEEVDEPTTLKVLDTVGLMFLTS